LSELLRPQSTPQQDLLWKHQKFSDIRGRSFHFVIFQFRICQESCEPDLRSEGFACEVYLIELVVDAARH